MVRRNVSRDETKERVHQLSLFPEPMEESELLTGRPSALEQAIWSNQFQPIKRRVFFQEQLTEETILDHMRNNDYGQRMFEWGTEHGYPQHSICIDGRVAAVVATGRRSWATVCTVYDSLLMSFAVSQLKETEPRPSTPGRPVDVSLDQKARDEVMALGRKRGWWYYFARVIMPARLEKIPLEIVGGEEHWRLFAYGVDSAYVTQMRTKLQHQAIRDALYEKAGTAGWPQFSYSSPSAWEVRLGGEPSWRGFCAEMGHEDFQYVYEHLFKEGKAI